MPDHIRFILWHAFIGFVISVAFTVLILALNVGNLWHLVTHTSGGMVAVAMLFMFNGIVFAGVQFARGPVRW